MFEIKNYFETSSLIIKSLAKHEIEIDKICKEILNCDNNNNKILVAGNGVHVLIVNILLENYNALLKKEIENLFQRSHYLVYLRQ